MLNRHFNFTLKDFSPCLAIFCSLAQNQSVWFDKHHCQIGTKSKFLGDIYELDKKSVFVTTGCPNNFETFSNAHEGYKLGSTGLFLEYGTQKSAFGDLAVTFYLEVWVHKGSSFYSDMLTLRDHRSPDDNSIFDLDLLIQLQCNIILSWITAGKECAKATTTSTIQQLYSKKF